MPTSVAATIHVPTSVEATRHVPTSVEDYSTCVEVRGRLLCIFVSASEDYIHVSTSVEDYCKCSYFYRLLYMCPH